MFGVMALCVNAELLHVSFTVCVCSTALGAHTLHLNDFDLGSQHQGLSELNSSLLMSLDLNTEKLSLTLAVEMCVVSHTCAAQCVCV